MSVKEYLESAGSFIGRSLSDYTDFSRSINQEFDGEPRTIGGILTADADTALKKLEGIEQEINIRVYETLLEETPEIQEVRSDLEEEYSEHVAELILKGEFSRAGMMAGEDTAKLEAEFREEYSDEIEAVRQNYGFELGTKPDFLDGSKDNW